MESDVRFRLVGFPCIQHGIFLLLKELWLAIDEVVHHDDVMALIIIWPWRNVAGLNPDECDAGIIKLDGEEGQVSIAWRGGNRTAEYQSAVLAEVLDERARLVVAACRAKRAAVRLVYICEHHAEASNCCDGIAVGTRYGEGRFGDVVSHRSEQSRRAERPERGGVGGIAKEQRQPALRPARWRSL